jgi:hypothetical protein
MKSPETQKPDEQEKQQDNAKASKEKPGPPEKTLYSRYYEHDGALRAYANRAMVIAFLSVPVALIAVALAAYVRIQPPTVIRVDASGTATVVGAKSGSGGTSADAGAGAEPTEFDRKAFIRQFLDKYMNFSPDTVNRNFADSVNMMTSNLRRDTIAALQKDNTIGKIQDDQITCVFRIQSLEPAKDDPLSFTAFGVKEIHKIHDHAETTDKLIDRFSIRLITEKRTELNPRGLLIADYGEQVIEGEHRN